MKKIYLIICAIAFAATCMLVWNVVSKNSAAPIMITESPKYSSDPIAERLYKEAVDNALVKKIDGYASGMTYRLHVPNRYFASTTKVTFPDPLAHDYKELGEIEVTRIYDSNIPYQTSFLEIFTLPYDKKYPDDLIKSEKNRHTKTFGVGGEYTYIGTYEQINSESNSSFNRIISRNLGLGMGESTDAYYVYFFPTTKTYDHVLVVRASFDSQEINPILQERAHLFFKIINEMIVW